MKKSYSDRSKKIKSKSYQKKGYNSKSGYPFWVMGLNGDLRLSDQLKRDSEDFLKEMLEHRSDLEDGLKHDKNIRDRFIDNVGELLKAYEYIRQDNKEMKAYLRKRKHKLQSNIDKARKKRLKNTQEHASAIYEVFMAVKEELMESGVRYSKTELAHRLTEKKVPPPGGKEGDAWNNVSILRYEERMGFYDHPDKNKGIDYPQGINKADRYALSINADFQKIKTEITDQDGKYSKYKLAKELTTNKVAPPRGKAGDAWSIPAVTRHEERIRKLLAK